MLFPGQLPDEIRTVLQAITKSFALIGDAKAAAEVENSVVIIQRKLAEELFQFFETIANLRRIGFVGFCISLVKLIQNGFAAAITAVKGVRIYVFS